MTSGYVCTSCGAACAADTHEPKCRCGGLFELDFTPPAWDPARIDRSEWSIFRYRDFMAVDGDIWRSVTMGEGMTPVIEMDGRNGVLLKMDYAMPTLSFKDRGAATLVSHMLAIGVRTCVQDSSGNAGNSVAAYAARAGIACEIYVPDQEDHDDRVPRRQGARGAGHARPLRGRLPRAGGRTRRVLRQPRLQPVLLRRRQ